MTRSKFDSLPIITFLGFATKIQQTTDNQKMFRIRGELGNEKMKIEDTVKWWKQWISKSIYQYIKELQKVLKAYYLT